MKKPINDITFQQISEGKYYRVKLLKKVHTWEMYIPSYYRAILGLVDIDRIVGVISEGRFYFEVVTPPDEHVVGSVTTVNYYCAKVGPHKTPQLITPSKRERMSRDWDIIFHQLEDDYPFVTYKDTLPYRNPRLYELLVDDVAFEAEAVLMALPATTDQLILEGIANTLYKHNDKIPKEGLINKVIFGTAYPNAEQHLEVSLNTEHLQYVTTDYWNSENPPTKAELLKIYSNEILRIREWETSGVEWPLPFVSTRLDTLGKVYVVPGEESYMTIFEMGSALTSFLEFKPVGVVEPAKPLTALSQVPLLILVLFKDGFMESVNVVQDISVFVNSTNDPKRQYPELRFTHQTHLEVFGNMEEYQQSTQHLQ